MPKKLDEAPIKSVAAKLGISDIDLMDKARFRMKELTQQDISVSDFIRFALRYYCEVYLRSIGEWEDEASL